MQVESPTVQSNRIFTNYHYAALEKGGKCFCGSAEPHEELDLSDCPMTCSADDKDYCGGKNYHATIYFVENTISMSCHRTDVFDQHVYKS